MFDISKQIFYNIIVGGNNMDNLIDTFANRLTYALTIRNIKPIELAEMTKIDKSKISSYMSGRYKAKTDGLKIIADALNVSPVWLMGYDVPMERNLDKNIQGLDKKSEYGATVMVYGSIPAGMPIELIEDIVDTEEIPVDMLKGGKQYIGVKVKGDSMEPEYLNGDTLIVLVQPDCESGDDCIVMVNGNEGTFKRVFKSENGIILQPLNNKYSPMPYSNEQIEQLPVRILGVVEEIRRKKRRK